MSRKVLIIEDDPEIIELLSMHLPDIDMDLESAMRGDIGLEKAIENDYELIILDIMLPKMDGLDVCKAIRQQNKSVPILMLTAKSEEFDKVLGLELGADDYMTKPFSIRELIARIKAIIRRVDAVQQEKSDLNKKGEIIFGPLVINFEKRKVTVKEKLVELTAKEFDLLSLFATNPGKAYDRETLLNLVWGYQFIGYEHTVNSHINRLRAKIEDDPSSPLFIKTVWGVGYKFVEIEDFEL